MNSDKTKFCFKCGKEIALHSDKCPYCGEEIDSYSRIFPIRKLLPLLILTYNLYIFYWFYELLEYFKKEKNLDISPTLRTIGLVIPILNLVFIYELFELIEKYAKEEGLDTYSSGKTIIAVIVFNFFIAIPGMGLWPFISVQETLNEYWMKKEGNLPINRYFSSSEKLVLILGGITVSAIWIFLMIYT